MKQRLSPHTNHLLAQRSSVMDLPNDQVRSALRELVHYIAFTPELERILKEQGLPYERHLVQKMSGSSADLVYNAHLSEAVWWMEEGQEVLSRFPTTTNGQRTALEDVLKWLFSAQRHLEQHKQRRNDGRTANT